MDIKKIKYFVEAVKAKTISRAAKRLDVDQSIFSRSLRSLEDDLNANLYVHYDKTFKLTEKGVVAYKYFQKILGTCSDLTKNLSDTTKPERTTLNIISSNGTANYYLIDNVDSFLKENQNIYLSFTTNDLIQKLDIDIDASIGPKLEGPNIESFYLYSYYLKMYASPQYLEKHGHPQSPEDLDNHRLIGYSREDISMFIDFDWHLRFGSGNGVSRKPYLQVSSSYAIQRAAQHHLGIITFSKLLNLNSDLGLIDIFPKEKGLKVDIYFSHHIHKDNLEAILLYRDYLRKYFRSLPFYED